MHQHLFSKTFTGHPYLITECGQAMQVGQCPVCKEQIGGQSHRLLDSNRRADQIMMPDQIPRDMSLDDLIRRNDEQMARRLQDEVDNEGFMRNHNNLLDRDFF